MPGSSCRAAPRPAGAPPGSRPPRRSRRRPYYITYHICYRPVSICIYVYMYICVCIHIYIYIYIYYTSRMRAWRPYLYNIFLPVSRPSCAKVDRVELEWVRFGLGRCDCPPAPDSENICYHIEQLYTICNNYYICYYVEYNNCIPY